MTRPQPDDALHRALREAALRRADAGTRRPRRKPRPIGIVACTAEGAALCYRTICTEGSQLLGPSAHPEVSLHSHSLADYLEPMRRGDWDAVGELMLSSAQKLARAGAEVLVCPVNTIHQALPLIEARSPLPWLHIAEVVAEHAAERGFRRVGIVGTRQLVESDIYPAKLVARGLEYVRPAGEDRAALDRIIYGELVRGVFLPESIESLQGVIRRLEAAGCDAVALACTEVPLVIGDENSSLPTLDSTRLLARAALRHAVQEAALA